MEELKEKLKSWDNVDVHINRKLLPPPRLKRRREEVVPPEPKTLRQWELEPQRGFSHIGKTPKAEGEMSWHHLSSAPHGGNFLEASWPCIHASPVSFLPVLL